MEPFIQEKQNTYNPLKTCVARGAAKPPGPSQLEK